MMRRRRTTILTVLEDVPSLVRLNKAGYFYELCESSICDYPKIMSTDALKRRGMGLVDEFRLICRWWWDRSKLVVGIVET